MALGRYTSDLEPGDILGPVEYRRSAFTIREYSHANENHHTFFQGSTDLIAPPTLIHLDKLRLYNHACPGGPGPTARIHYEYDATYYDEVPADEDLVVSGKVTDRYRKRGRDHVIMELELRAKSDNRLLVHYRDDMIVSYQAADDDAAGERPGGGA